MNTRVDVVYAKRIKAGSLAALVFTGTATLMVPMCVFFGFLALFGAKTVHLNGSYVTGIIGLVLSLVYGAFLTGIMGLGAWIAAYLGIRLIGHFRPYRIEYVAPLERTPNPAPPPPPAPGSSSVPQEPRQS